MSCYYIAVVTTVCFDPKKKKKTKKSAWSESQDAQTNDTFPQQKKTHHVYLIHNGGNQGFHLVSRYDSEHFRISVQKNWTCGNTDTKTKMKSAVQEVWRRIEKQQLKGRDNGNNTWKWFLRRIDHCWVTEKSSGSVSASREMNRSHKVGCYIGHQVPEFIKQRQLKWRQRNWNVKQHECLWMTSHTSTSAEYERNRLWTHSASLDSGHRHKSFRKKT